jgi:hypothetical protein
MESNGKSEAGAFIYVSYQRLIFLIWITLWIVRHRTGTESHDIETIKFSILPS